VPQLQKLRLSVGAQSFVFSVLRGKLAPGAAVYLIDCPALFARPTLYTSDTDEHVRFLAFTRAALMACREMRWAPRIIHCNDWHTSFAPLFLRTLYRAEPLLAPARTLLTIHNIGYQGIFPAARVADLGLEPEQLPLLYQPDLAGGRINALRHGILYADAINTVSPTHAREICSDEYGMGLEDSLRARAADVSGILNGVDYEEWDPRRDRYLPAHYDPLHLSVKAQLKGMFVERHGLTPGADIPLAGIVSRLAAQKGIELMFEGLPRILAARPMNFVALGNGEARYEDFFSALARSFPARVHFHRGYDDELAHWIEAASDLFLMPSRYEPCGLNQMYSMRYGTVPVVHAVGGLADTVEEFDVLSRRGTGFTFLGYAPAEMVGALRRALAIHRQPELWKVIQTNGMSRDFSWRASADGYDRLYAEARARVAAGRVPTLESLRAGG
jgi:starch synthase